MRKITIIVPVYNVELYLIECISSIVNQTYSNIEIIIVDDGSKDQSGTICNEFAKMDSRIKVIHTSNGGLSAARNVGIRNSSGEYIMFVDGDDFITINAVEDIVNIINKQEDIQIITGKMIEYYDSRKQVKENFMFVDNKFHGKNGIQILTYFFQEIPVIMWSACRSIYKRELLIDNNFYFTEGITSEDMDLVPRVYMHADKIASYDIPFYYYRQLRPNSIVNTVNAKRFYDIIFIIDRYLAMLENNQYPIEFKYIFRENIANIYAWYAGMIGEVPKKERKNVINKMKEKDFLFKYATSFRGKSIAVFRRYFGFTITFMIYKCMKQIMRYKNKIFKL